MLRDALRYPVEGKDIGRQYLVATVFYYGSLLVLPFFVVLGYYTKIMSETLEGSEGIPKFNEYKSLFFKGLKTTGVFTLYVILPLMIIAARSDITANTALQSLIAVAMLAPVYFFPSAMTRFAETGKAKDSLDLRQVAEKSMTTKYLKGYGVLLVTSITVTLVQLAVFILALASVIGIPALIVLYPMMRFYEGIAYFRIMAEMSR